MLTLTEILEQNPDIIDWLNKKAEWLKSRRNWFVDASDVAGEALIAIVARDRKEPLSFENLNQFKGYAVDALSTKATNMLRIEHKHASVSVEGLQEQGFDVMETDRRENPFIDEQHRAIAALIPKLKRQKERDVIEMTLQGMKPRDILKARPDFGTTNAIYLLKNQAISKLQGMVAQVA